MGDLIISVSGIMTEHSGPKKGRGGFYGRKREAKRVSDKRRRGEDTATVRDTNPKSGNEPSDEDP